MIRKEVIDYRCLHEQSVSMIKSEIITDIAVLMVTKGLLKFKKKNQFSFGDKKITGVLLQENGMFILTGDKMFEIDEDDETFAEFEKDIYNLISLYESVVKQIGLKID
jgi:hypothetical protein